MRSRAVIAVVFLLGGSPAHAGPADLDPAFGNGGIAAIPFPAASSTANAVVLQGDGKIVAAGYAGTDFALARCNADGTLDPSFGAGGLVAVDFDGADDRATALVLQPDGKLVAAGARAVPTSAVLARYQADGTPDATFGTSGRVVTPGLEGRALVLQPDGKLVVGGAGTSGFTLVRYDDEGNVDAAFGSGGVATTDFAPSPGAIPQLFALALQPDGKLVAAGGAGEVFALARFDADGVLDPTFGTGGQVTTNVAPFPGFSGSAMALAVVMQPDGKIAATGVSNSHVPLPGPGGGFGTVYAALVVRYAADGTLDQTFNGSGRIYLTFEFDRPSSTQALALQAEGKLVAGGFQTAASERRYFLGRLTSAGTVDASFSGSLLVTGEVRALAVQPDRKLVAAGYGGSPASPTFQIVRFFGGECGDGVLDAGEACDDANLTNGDGCDANCTPTGCGNGIVTAGEECDPAAADACCAATCGFAPAETGCASNGNLCAVHTCDGAGTCRHDVAPSDTCSVAPPGKSSIQLAHIGVAEKRALTWSWQKGAIAVGDIADPTQTPYALCVYDRASGTPVQKMKLPVPGIAALWRSASAGFDYKDHTATFGGVISVRLRTDTKGLGRLQVKARGTHVPPIGSVPMSVDPRVTVQLRNAAGGCWGADFSAPKRNDSTSFKAKSD